MPSSGKNSNSLMLAKNFYSDYWGTNCPLMEKELSGVMSAAFVDVLAWGDSVIWKMF